MGGDIFQLILPQKSIFGTGDVDHMPFLQYAKYVASSGYNLNMLATRLTFGEPDPEETEQLEVLRLPLVEAIEMARDGRIRDSVSVLALLAIAR